MPTHTVRLRSEVLGCTLSVSRGLKTGMPRKNIKVLFVAGFGPIVQDQELSGKLYVKNLGISFQEGEGGYLHTEKVDGVKHFALWPLSQAAQSCFGTVRWPKDIPIPQAWLEFDVEDVEAATKELQKQGYKLLVSARKEPWGQIVTRLLSPEGLLIGVVYTPWMRDQKK
jgi:glyoxalase/bleomycin resistance protein/dioxygenase superfamily protein